MQKNFFRVPTFYFCVFIFKLFVYNFFFYSGRKLLSSNETIMRKIKVLQFFFYILALFWENEFS